MNTWKRCTAERYEEMLGVLPPATMSGYGFLVGEATRHRRCAESGEVRASYAAFVQVGGNYFEGPDMTKPEWRALYVEQIPADVRIREIAAGPAMAAAIRATLFQLCQGKVLDRDDCARQLRESLAAYEGREP